MKRILIIALSTMGLGGTLLALIQRSRRQRNGGIPATAISDAEERQADRSVRRSPASGMSVKRDGSLAIPSEGRRKPSTQHDAEKKVHLKKDGSPDRRYKENRSED